MMTKSQKGAIEKYLTKLLMQAADSELRLNETNNAETTKLYLSHIAQIGVQFDTARYILTTLGYGGYVCEEESKYVLYKLS